LTLAPRFSALERTADALDTRSRRAGAISPAGRPPPARSIRGRNHALATRPARALALTLIVACYAVTASCEKLIEALATGFFTLDVHPRSVTLSPTPDQGECGTAYHVVITVTHGLGAGEGDVGLSLYGDVDGVALTTCHGYDSEEGIFAVNSPTVFRVTAVDLDDGESQRLDLIFRPSAAALPGTYPIVITASEDDSDRSGSRDIKTATVHLNILPPIPPTVSITGPAAGASVPTSTVTLTGTADDDVAVVSMAYRLNGGAEQGVTLGAPITAWSFDVPGLMPGANAIDVLARDGAGLVGSASVTVSYAPTSPQLTCNQPLEAALGLGETVLYDLAVPAADLAYALRVESVDLDGSYSILADGVPRFLHKAIGTAVTADELDLREPGVVYAASVRADNAAGTFRLYLVCEQPLTLGANVTVTQLGGLMQLYRFDGPSQPIHMGLHRAQVVNSIGVGVWYRNGSLDLNPVGNPAGGYASGEFVRPILDVGEPHTVIWEALGFASSDVDEYTFAVSTVADPVELTLNASNSATAQGDVQHLGQLHYFTFQGVQGESYTVTLDHPSGSLLAAEVAVERLDPSLPFYTAAGLVATGATTRDPAERSVTLGPFVLPATGTYAIRIGANASLTYDASLAETEGAFTMVLERQ
jgi:hypothetical protein